MLAVQCASSPIRVVMQIPLAQAHRRLCAWARELSCWTIPGVTLPVRCAVQLFLADSCHAERVRRKSAAGTAALPAGLVFYIRQDLRHRQRAGFWFSAVQPRLCAVSACWHPGKNPQHHHYPPRILVCTDALFVRGCLLLLCSFPPTTCASLRP